MRIGSELFSTQLAVHWRTLKCELVDENFGHWQRDRVIRGHAFVPSVIISISLKDDISYLKCTSRHVIRPHMSSRVYFRWRVVKRARVQLACVCSVADASILEWSLNHPIITMALTRRTSPIWCHIATRARQKGDALLSAH